jgi:hypothetical protein
MLSRGGKGWASGRTVVALAKVARVDDGLVERLGRVDQDRSATVGVLCFGARVAREVSLSLCPTPGRVVEVKRFENE